MKINTMELLLPSNTMHYTSLFNQCTVREFIVFLQKHFIDDQSIEYYVTNLDISMHPINESLSKVFKSGSMTISPPYTADVESNLSLD